MRTGVFICHCGENIAGSVDVERLKANIKALPTVVCVEDYRYLCSDVGQKLIAEKIREYRLDRVVVSACSPSLHAELFRGVVASSGLNSDFLARANIREQVSWVHPDDKNRATEKAGRLIAGVIRSVRGNKPVRAHRIEIERTALILGGGIGGISAALTIADAGYKVILVEKQPSIGGHMAQLSETFPTLDCAQCILTPKMSAVLNHKNIELLTYSELEAVEGSVGDFSVKIRKRARGVDEKKCIACYECIQKCPVRVKSEFDYGLGERKAIYIPFPQAVPNVPVIDRNNCRQFTGKKCGVCAKACPRQCIDYEGKDEVFERRVGVIIVATGYETYPKENLRSYRADRFADVIDGLQFERMLSASGPTSGKIVRPSDGKVPETIAFIQCAGSRDKNHLEHCSRICCIYTAKQALLSKKRLPSSSVYVFYIDVRTAGKNYEEFYERAQNEGVVYIRGKVTEIKQKDGKLILRAENTLIGSIVEIAADMVILSTGLKGSKDAQSLNSLLKLASDKAGFFKEAHPKLRPSESMIAGVFLAGCGQAPRDVQDTVAHSQAAASQALLLLSKPYLERIELTAFVDPDTCTGCGICVTICPYGALKIDEKKKVSTVDSVLCEGCGACSVACPSCAIVLANSAPAQVFETVRSLTV